MGCPSDSYYRMIRGWIENLNTFQEFNKKVNLKGIKSSIDLIKLQENQLEQIAEDILKNNKYDIHEMCYKYAVIEEIGKGVYPKCFNRLFFKWNKNKNCYVAIDEPECVKNISNFSIG